ncbi:hypothetical protein HPO96_17035 [Kribbella sandramycini]|uniref:DUF8175 domain-containing protein n=1 Tax=Kribbella sandramycini TaxID=60450 RepID=A0A7Y4L097_9ACTN|nr:hypothetical protein [Kribbella sandramycini]MBB6565691.1 hypothetical protein [Kribbella sandramycini]NOL41953.1 hypothetical protein [Kribbella sandramycini]
MTETDDTKTPYGPGFTAACIVIVAVLVCGVVLLVAGRGADAGDATTHLADPAAAAAGARAGEAGAPLATAEPAAPPVGRAGGCGGSASDRSVPSKAPAVDGWEVSNRVVVPRSAAVGPAKTDPDGFRRCFAHSPTGALYAAYNALAAMADQSKLVSIARRLMLPSAETEQLIRQLSKESATGFSSVQPTGYRMLAAADDRVTVLLALPVESVYMSATLTLVWHQGDWRLQPPPPGEAVGAPFAQHRDLGDFVKWSGI